MAQMIRSRNTRYHWEAGGMHQLLVLLHKALAQKKDTPTHMICCFSRRICHLE